MWTFICLLLTLLPTKRPQTHLPIPLLSCFHLFHVFTIYERQKHAVFPAAEHSQNCVTVSYVMVWPITAQVILSGCWGSNISPITPESSANQDPRSHCTEPVCGNIPKYMSISAAGENMQLHVISHADRDEFACLSLIALVSTACKCMWEWIFGEHVGERDRKDGVIPCKDINSDDFSHSKEYFLFYMFLSKIGLLMLPAKKWARRHTCPPLTSPLLQLS